MNLTRYGFENIAIFEMFSTSKEYITCWYSKTPFS